MLSKDYSTVEEAVKAMKEYGKEIDEAVSIGLGAGDNRQAAVVAEISKVMLAVILIKYFLLLEQRVLI